MLGPNYSGKASELIPIEANALEPLDELGQHVLALVEQFYWTNKKLLPVVNLVERTGLDEAVVKKIYDNPTFQQALRAKGFLTSAKFTNSLTPRQILAGNMVTTRQDTRSLREKLKEANVTISEWNGWMSNPTFYKYVQSKSGFDFKTAEVIAERTLLNAMEDGDLTAVKFFMELRGRYQNKVSVNLNFDLMITQIVETLSVFIPEEKLEEAADALERIYAINSGRNVEQVMSNVIELIPAI